MSVRSAKCRWLRSLVEMRRCPESSVATMQDLREYSRISGKLHPLPIAADCYAGWQHTAPLRPQ